MRNSHGVFDRKKKSKINKIEKCTFVEQIKFEFSIMIFNTKSEDVKKNNL